VAIARMERLYARYGERLAAHVLAPSEKAALARTSRPAGYLAMRFAAKEAFSKALGTGLRAPVRMIHIEVTKDALGCPGFRFAAVLDRWLKARGVARAHLSLSDEGGYALAFVIVEKDKPSPTGSSVNGY